MPIVKQSATVIVDENPNDIAELQSGHTIPMAILDTGEKGWRYIPGNAAGKKWVLHFCTLYNIAIESVDRPMENADRDGYRFNDNGVTLTFNTESSTWNVPIGSSGVFKRVEDDGHFEILAGAGVEINGETSVTYEIDGGSDKDTNGVTWIKVDTNSYHLIGAVTKIP